MSIEFRISTALMIVIGWIIFYSMLFRDNYFDLTEHLPLELCNIMQICILYAVIFNKKKALDIMLCPLVLGPLVAFVYPFGIVTFGWDYLVYFIYYHVTLMYVGIYRIIKKELRLNFKTIVYNAIFVYLCAGIVAIINPLINANYMFITKPIFTLPINYYLFFNLVTMGCLFGFYFLVNGMRVFSYNEILKKVYQKKAG